jgi:hypothetical protein
MVGTAEEESEKDPEEDEDAGDRVRRSAVRTDSL